MARFATATGGSPSSGFGAARFGSALVLLLIAAAAQLTEAGIYYGMYGKRGYTTAQVRRITGRGYGRKLLQAEDKAGSRFSSNETRKP